MRDPRITTHPKGTMACRVLAIVSIIANRKGYPRHTAVMFDGLSLRPAASRHVDRVSPHVWARHRAAA